MTRESIYYFCDAKKGSLLRTFAYWLFFALIILGWNVSYHLGIQATAEFAGTAVGIRSASGGVGVHVICETGVELGGSLKTGYPTRYSDYDSYQTEWSLMEGTFGRGTTHHSFGHLFSSSYFSPSISTRAGVCDIYVLCIPYWWLMLFWICLGGINMFVRARRRSVKT